MQQQGRARPGSNSRPLVNLLTMAACTTGDTWSHQGCADAKKEMDGTKRKRTRKAKMRPLSFLEVFPETPPPPLRKRLPASTPNWRPCNSNMLVPAELICPERGFSPDSPSSNRSCSRSRPCPPPQPNTPNYQHQQMSEGVTMVSECCEAADFLDCHIHHELLYLKI